MLDVLVTGGGKTALTAALMAHEECARNFREGRVKDG